MPNNRRRENNMALKESRDYYTAAQVKNILGITDGMLYNYVDNGALERIIPPGKKQGVYRRDQVDQLARDLKVFIVTREKHTCVFSRMTTREEVLESTKLSDAIFGGHIDIDRQMAWLKRNPDIAYIVKSEGKVVGYAIVLPLKPEKIAKLLREEEYTTELEADEIQLFEPGVPLHLYGGAIGVLPGISLAEKRVYGARLVGGLIDTLIELGKKGIVIASFTARSTKPDGIRLLRNIGFTQIESITEKKDFVLDVELSGAREVMQYKLALKEHELQLDHDREKQNATQSSRKNGAESRQKSRSDALSKASKAEGRRS
jgi:hypothetical protein